MAFAFHFLLSERNPKDKLWQPGKVAPWNLHQKVARKHDGKHATIFWRTDLFNPNTNCSNEGAEPKVAVVSCHAPWVSADQPDAQGSQHSMICLFFNISTFGLLVVQAGHTWTTFTWWTIHKWSDSPLEACIGSTHPGCTRNVAEVVSCLPPCYGRFQVFNSVNSLPMSSQ